MTLVIAWRTTKLIEGGHRGLQAYRPICYYFYVFLRFLRFFFKIQKRDFLRFLAVFDTFSRSMDTSTVNVTDGRTDRETDRKEPKYNKKPSCF